MRFRLRMALSGVLGLACAAPLSEATLPCIAPMEVRWLADSSARLCLPAGFDLRGPNTFVRHPRDGSSEHWLSVTIARGPDPVRHSLGWPVPLPPGGCLADCGTTAFRLV